MKKNITIKMLLLPLLFVTGPAWAEWKEISETDEAIYYIDPTTIRKEGNLRKIWVLKHHKKRSATGSKSVLNRDEFDCTNELRRYLVISGHTELQAKGETLMTIKEPGKWGEIPPHSTAAHIFATVCAQ